MTKKKILSIISAAVILLSALSIPIITLFTASASNNNTSPVSFEYKTVNDWGAGFNGEFLITNNTNKNITNWTLEFTWNRNITNFYTCKQISKSQNTYKVNSYSWNNTIESGKTLSLGFQGNPGNVNDIPTNIILTSDNGSFNLSNNDNSSTNIATTPIPVSPPISTEDTNSNNKPSISDDIQIKYDTLNNWVTGFNGQFTITNNSNKSISNWMLEFKFKNDISSFYTSQKTSKNNDIYKIKGMSYNNTIHAKQSIQLGFQGVGNISTKPEIISFTADNLSTGTEKPVVTTPTTPETPVTTPEPEEPEETQKPEKPKPVTNNNDDWLHTVGNKIVDRNGKQVWLTGTNWFGFNTGTNAFDGMWSCSMKDSLHEMANRGINILRVPISTELLQKWSKGNAPSPTSVNYNENPELKGLNSLQIFDKALEYCKQYGIKVLLDVHSAKTDPMGHLKPLWYDGNITTEMFYSAWVWVAQRYKNDDTIVAFDLQNEPHGEARWDNSNSSNNWKNVAQECAKRILAVHPNILILVEGVEITSDNTGTHYNWWGGNLRGVSKYPINLGAHQDQLVYSPHDYGPKVSKQSWFYNGFNKDTLYKDCWRDNWAYIHEQNIAPLLMGEWGGFMDGGSNEKWLYALREFMIEKRIHHTFWCFNSNSGDTGGLVKSDFKTWDEAKYNLLKPALWNIGGKFVGLDHKIKLGDNGTHI